MILLKLPFKFLLLIGSNNKRSLLCYNHSRTLNIIILKINVTTKGTFRRENESYLNIKQKRIILPNKTAFNIISKWYLYLYQKKVKSIVI